jgi:ubiquinone/menaquinone biosynthesis C-methylase UbiE
LAGQTEHGEHLDDEGLSVRHTSLLQPSGASRDETDAVGAHYGFANLADRIFAALDAAGQGTAPTPDDLAPVDQLHIGGQSTTRQLAQRAGLRAGQTVLDVGGGIGGPARTLASEHGCSVTVLDLTEAYCRTGEQLTALTGLTDRVTFRRGNALAMPFADGSFDVVWTQHSSMNIEAKERLYAEVHRVLRPGGRLALHEIMAGTVQPIHFPVPWARDPAISFLRPPQEMRALLPAAGFAEVAWFDVTPAALAWYQNRLAQPPPPAPQPLGVHVLLGPTFREMGRNMHRNLEEQRVAVVQGVFDRAKS